MPRRAVRALPALLLGTVFGIGGCAPEPLEMLVLQDVTIKTWCRTDSTVGFELQPWVRTVKWTPGAGDQVQWRLDPSEGTVSSYEIVLDSPADWPYPDMKQPGKGKGRPGIPLPSGKMKGNPKLGEPFKYQVKYYCIFPNGIDSVLVIIDPDVVVD